MMMKVLNLIWIVPLAVLFGIVIMGLVVAMGDRDHWYERYKDES